MASVPGKEVQTNSSDLVAGPHAESFRLSARSSRSLRSRLTGRRQRSESVEPDKNGGAGVVGSAGPDPASSESVELGDGSSVADDSHEAGTFEDTDLGRAPEPQPPRSLEPAGTPGSSVSDRREQLPQGDPGPDEDGDAVVVDLGDLPNLMVDPDSDALLRPGDPDDKGDPPVVDLAQLPAVLIQPEAIPSLPRVSPSATRDEEGGRRWWPLLLVVAVTVLGISLALPAGRHPAGTLISSSTDPHHNAFVSGCCQSANQFAEWRFDPAVVYGRQQRGS